MRVHNNFSFAEFKALQRKHSDEFCEMFKIAMMQFGRVSPMMQKDTIENDAESSLARLFTQDGHILRFSFDYQDGHRVSNSQIMCNLKTGKYFYRQENDTDAEFEARFVRFIEGE